MSSFKDRKDRSWDLHIDVDQQRKIKKTLGIKLPGLITDSFQPLQEMSSDNDLFASVLFCLCEDQAKARQIDTTEFGKGFDGDVIWEAKSALEVAITNFFPKHQRHLLTKAFQKTNEAVDELGLAIDEELDSQDTKAMVKEAVAKAKAAYKAAQDKSAS